MLFFAVILAAAVIVSTCLYGGIKAQAMFDKAPEGMGFFALFGLPLSGAGNYFAFVYGIFFSILCCYAAIVGASLFVGPDASLQYALIMPLSRTKIFVEKMLAAVVLYTGVFAALWLIFAGMVYAVAGSVEFGALFDKTGAAFIMLSFFNGVVYLCAGALYGVCSQREASLSLAGVLVFVVACLVRLIVSVYPNLNMVYMLAGELGTAGRLNWFGGAVIGTVVLIVISAVFCLLAQRRFRIKEVA
jgi:ABC-type transport system involved in multi-copper enzyme maturation permease subunit